MVWFFLIPSIPSVIGNFVIPLMIGARDVAFPRLNLTSWYLFMGGGLVALYALIVGGVDTGWTFYTPYSTTYSNGHVMLMAAGVFITGFSSILTGLNFIVTIHKLRAPGLTWFRLPLFIWSLYATSLILVLATPVLAITLLLMALENGFGVGVFDPKLGGDPLLFQHLFWFYSHPAVYIMILPGMGVVSEVVATFARKPVFGYKAVAFASLAIAVLGFLVWGHHMFVSSQSIFAGLVFSLLSFLVAVPSAIKVFNWTATLHRASITFETPLLYALGFMGLFTVGGLTGLFVASVPVDVHVHDTYFVVAHFHYVMVGGMVLAYMGALHYWWPKISGRLYHEWTARVTALITFIGFNLTFFPQFILGYLGHAAALSHLPAGISGAQCAVHGGRLDPRDRLHPAALLSWLVVLPRPARRPESLGCDRPRMAHRVARARTQLRGDAGGRRRTLSTSGHGGGRGNRHRPFPGGGDAMSRVAAPSTHAKQFSDVEQRLVADHLGMWTFLCTEILFFGGLLAAYAVYRWAYHDGFVEGSKHLNFWIGTINTGVLLTSSVFVALGDNAIKQGHVRALRWCLIAAWILGFVFLCLKGYEYYHHYEEHMVPGLNFHTTEPHAAQLEMFTYLYFALTGLHAAHMTVGLIVILWLLWSVHHHLITRDEPTRMEIAGLYWHFVDVVWVFLYPLLYLIQK